jgi:hypothetical protein
LTVLAVPDAKVLPPFAGLTEKGTLQRAKALAGTG